jgi:NADH-quinone oxidoreductase subunit G
LHSPQRKIEPRRLSRTSAPTPTLSQKSREVGRYENIEWSQIPRDLAADLNKICGAGGSETNGSGGRLAAVVSPNLTVEEAFLLCKLARSFDPGAILALGPVPVVGDDETFPGKFTIHAEKCPNRLGVEAVLAHFSGGAIKTFEELLTELPAGQIKAAWVTGGYPDGNWIDDASAALFAGLELVIMQDMFDSPLWQLAAYQLPGAGFAERSGSYVNFAHRLQSFDWAIRPPAGVWIEGHLYWTMLGKRGLYNARSVLSEVAGEIIAFNSAAGKIPTVGIDLRVNQLATASAV